MKKDQLPTPALVVDKIILEDNIRKMADKTKQLGINLRPHIKTHKSKQIAQMQLNAGAIGVTCAKISEAEVVVEAGVDDVFIAYPMLGDYQLEKAIDLAKRCRLTLAFDSHVAAAKINHYAEAANIKLRASMIINTGGNRDGVLPENALALAEEVRPLANLTLIGVMTHEGHLHGCQDMEDVTKQATLSAKMLVMAAESLRDAGFPVEIVSTGSTIAAYSDADVQGITEWRPGTYVFNDVMTNDFYTTEANCALTIMATIVSHPAENKYIIDAGTKVLSEAVHPSSGYGIIKSAPQASIKKLNEEHGIIMADDGTFEIGQKVEIIPIHVCTAVNLSNSLYIVEHGEVVDSWKVDARGFVL